MTIAQDIAATAAAPLRGLQPPAVQLKNVTKRFGEVTAVDGLSLTIAPGEVVALLGPHGAGKTTTIDMVLGLADPTLGTVRVRGREPRQAVAHGLVSAVMQSGGLLKADTVEETVRLVASLFGADAQVPAVMARAGVTDFASRRVGKCSGGQQQRLRFALALLPDPELLILDEPTGSLHANAVSLAEAQFHPAAWVRAAYAGEDLVGFVMLHDSDAEPGYMLWRLMIDSRFQGRGYGRQVVYLAQGYLRGRPSAHTLKVGARGGRDGPAAFYMSLGFTATGEVVDEDEEIFARQL